MSEFLDKTGLTYFWSKLKTLLNGKQDTLVSGTNIKTVGGTSLLGNGNIALPTVPTNVSAFTNDAGYLTLSTLPIYDGTVTTP